MSEQQPFEPRRGISRHLTEEGALPICEQCNSSGYSKPINIRSSENGSIGFTVSQMWGHSRSEKRIADMCPCAMNAVGRSKWKPLPGKKLGLRAKTYMGFTRIVRNAKWDRKPKNARLLNMPGSGRVARIQW